MDWWLCAIFAALALSSLLICFRGRRVDDHPRCRRCRFDLTGRPSTSQRCPECGTVLSGASIIIGDRKRRGGWLLLGLSLLLLAIAFAFGPISRVRQIQWIQYEPIGWLLSEAAPTNPAPRSMNYTPDPAIDEIYRRIVAGSLTGRGRAAVVNRTLAVQANLSTPGAWQWENLLVALAEHGDLSASQWQRFIDQGIVTSLTTKPILRRGRRGMIVFRTINRLPGNLLLTGHCKSSGLCVDDVNHPIGGLPAEIFNEDLVGASGWSLTGPTRWSLTLAAGSGADQAHTLFVDQAFDVSIQGLPCPVVHFIRRTVCLVRVAGRDAIVDRFIANPKMQSVMASAEKGTRVRIACDADGTRVDIEFGSPPVPLSADVVLQRDGKSQMIGPARAETNWASNRVYDAMTKNSLALAGGFMDVVLRPSQEASDDHMTLDDYWGEPIVIPHVPVPTASLGQRQ